MSSRHVVPADICDAALADPQRACPLLACGRSPPPRGHLPMSFGRSLALRFNDPETDQMHGPAGAVRLLCELVGRFWGAGGH